MREETGPSPAHDDGLAAGSRRGMSLMWRRLDASRGHFSIDDLVAGGHRFEVTLPHATIEIASVYL